MDRTAPVLESLDAAANATMKIGLLGTGTPTPSLRRMCSGYLIEIGDDRIVLDHGFGSHHRLLELGVPATSITHLFLSHLHYDHCGDYARLVLTRWDQGAGKIPELEVFGPAPLAKMSRQLFDRDGVFGPDLVSRTEHQCSLDIYRARGGTLPRAMPSPHVTELAAGDVVMRGAWTVTVGAAAHFQPFLTPLAFRLDAPEGSVVYSGDSGPCASMAKLARDCDVLIHMCQYLSGTELGREFAKSCMGHMELARLGAECNAKSIVVTHVTEQIDQPGVRERLIREMSSVYKGHLFFGEDRMEIPVRAPAAAKLL
jgi:ribonuclease BN (tRNA processing enzyme)